MEEQTIEYKRVQDQEIILIGAYNRLIISLICYTAMNTRIISTNTYYLLNMNWNVN